MVKYILITLVFLYSVNCSDMFQIVTGNSRVKGSFLDNGIVYNSSYINFYNTKNNVEQFLFITPTKYFKIFDLNLISDGSTKIYYVNHEFYFIADLNNL